MTIKTTERHFTLIELLVVIGILGALLTLVIPAFHDMGADAKDKVARTEMKEIQKQFQRFYADCINVLKTSGEAGTEENPIPDTNRYLRDIALYGLWPLIVEKHPDAASGIKYDMYDPESGFGRHIPYLEYEGIQEIATPEMTFSSTARGGQTPLSTSENATGIRIPVIKDPYGGYYRVLCPEVRSEGDGGNNLTKEYKRLRRMVLVCTGPNRELDTATDHFIPSTDAEYVQSINGDDLCADGDDIVIRLLPGEI